MKRIRIWPPDEPTPTKTSTRLWNDAGPRSRSQLQTSAEKSRTPEPTQGSQRMVEQTFHAVLHGVYDRSSLGNARSSTSTPSARRPADGRSRFRKPRVPQGSTRTFESTAEPPSLTF